MTVDVARMLYIYIYIYKLTTYAYINDPMDLQRDKFGDARQQIQVALDVLRHDRYLHSAAEC